MSRASRLLALVVALFLFGPLGRGPLNDGSLAHAERGDCCQPVTDGAEPVTSDCLFMLRASVGISQCEPECVCAPRGVLPTTVTDALICLKYVIGNPVELACDCAVGSTTTTTLPVQPPDEWAEPLDASADGWLMSAWGPGDGSLWVVGGKFDDGVILRQGAGGWSRLDPGAGVPVLNWVHGTSRNDVFVGVNDGSILHWEGSSLVRQTTPATEPVWGIWAVAPDNVWAVGGEVLSSTPPFVLHYDGTSWSEVTLPTLVRPGVHAFFKVWGSSADNIYIVGQNGAVMHWDGSTFTELFLGVSQDLIAVWGDGPDNVFIVGGRGTAEILRFDGTSWNRAARSSLPGLNGVWLRNDNVAHAVGVSGTSVTIDPATLVATPDPVPSDLEMHAIFGDAQGQLVSVGANFFFPEVGVLVIRRITEDD